LTDILHLSDRISLLPILHGSGDFALEVRRRIHAGDFDCVAVPLPAVFEEAVLEAVDLLPRIHVVAQREGDISEDPSAYTLVPIDPCQPVIAALREAELLKIDTAFVDLEVGNFEHDTLVHPDPFALKEVPLERFAATLVPALPPPEPDSQREARIPWMAHQLHLLELDYERVLMVCAIQDWPWLRDAYRQRLEPPEPDGPVWAPEIFSVTPRSLYFALGELPFITHLYEHRRAEMLPDETLGVDGIKSLILESRTAWIEKHGLSNHWLTPQTLSLMLRYIRNLTLLDSRMSPDLYTVALAAKQIGGDGFAVTVIETARAYPGQLTSPHPDVTLGIDLGVFESPGPAGPSNDADTKNRLLGTERLWRELPLKPSPPPEKQRDWQTRWDPFRQCSYPPEDDRIESFNAHVREQARLLIGEDLARTEKFTSSLKDGLDIRETLRNWHTGDIYVKELPPARGTIEVVVFLFDTPADPNRYAWQTTWYAEHQEESTLCFYATQFSENVIGPGIAQAVYGGCFLMFPPRPIPDVWKDDRLSEAQSLEERLILGAAFHSRERRIALISATPPEGRWRRLARSCKKQLVYIPLNRFSLQTIGRLRQFHVLNGHEVRSYASKYIRDLR